MGLDLHLLQDCFELRQDLFGFGEQLQPRWRIALSYEFIRRLWCRSLHAAVSRRPGQTPRTGLLIPTDVTLAGGATDVWIFQLAQGLTVATAAKVVLSGGARASNVFWQVSGAVDLATTGHLEGIVLGQTSITLHAGASINGRLLAQAAVTIDGSVVVEPAP